MNKIYGEPKPSLDDLMHYGVKGMKWGVRRDRTTLSKEDRKQAKKNIKALSNKVIDEKYATGFFSRPMSKEEYNKLGTKDFVLKKGSTVQRVTRRKDEKFRDITYVSTNDKDKGVYRAVMPLQAHAFKMGGNRTYKTHYEATYKTLESLRSPSDKERVDAFTELFDKPSVTLKNGKTVTGRQYLKSYYPKEVKTLDSQQLGLRLYKHFTEEQYLDTPINSAYYKSLQQKGYNAVIDDNDRGHLSQTPVIILNPNGSLKRMSVKPLSADDINRAQLELKIH